ncbi:hypothetical protein Syun_011653 [Stephania yunnanensis]|uniref:Secreted protein n=1 Tax=Stephania yunnanensis TaxID=152371 RepID=A0AAP0PEJ6_9MAGN
MNLVKTLCFLLFILFLDEIMEAIGVRRRFIEALASQFGRLLEALCILQEQQIFCRKATVLAASVVRARAGEKYGCRHLGDLFFCSRQFSRSDALSVVEKC